ncbi:MAG: hypothetical protein KAW92_10355 [Candidatus Cloacimonetes bacterium]|nr:hypothetical protein [Candidatus Cloacimonadota bacterium]
MIDEEKFKDKDLEKIVLANLLTGDPDVKEIVFNLKDNYFCYTENKIILKIIKELAQEDQEINEVFVAQQLKKKNQLQDISNALSEIIDLGIFSIATFEPKKNELIDLYQKRQERKILIQAAQYLKEGKNIEEIGNYLIQETEKVIEEKTDNSLNLAPVSDYFHNVFNSFFEGKEEELKLNTGFDWLQNITNFGMKGFWLLLGAPNTGKTMFSINLMFNVLKNNPKAKIIFYSLDNTNINEVMARLLSCYSMDSDKPLTINDIKWIKDTKDKQKILHNITNSFLEKYSKNLHIITELPEYYTPAQMKHNIRKIKGNSKQALVVIDYMQILEHWFTAPQAFSRKDVIDYNIEVLNSIYQQLDITLFVISEVVKSAFDKFINPRAKDYNPVRIGDALGSSKLGYRPTNILTLTSEKTDHTIKRDNLQVLITMEKNKLDGSKGSHMFNFDNSHSRFKETKDGNL